MTHDDLNLELHRTINLVRKDLGKLPKKSVYRTWAYRLINDEEIPAVWYNKLRKRLTGLDCIQSPTITSDPLVETLEAIASLPREEV